MKKDEKYKDRILGFKNSETHAGIDFDDDTLVRFYRVDSPDELWGFTSDIDEFNDYIGPERTFDRQYTLNILTWSLQTTGQRGRYAVPYCIAR